MKHARYLLSFSVALWVAACLFALVFVGPASARDRIQIVGSSTVYPFSTVVAEKHGTKSKFKTPVIESTGTGGGMKLFCAGIGEQYPDVTNASRAMQESEWKMCRKNGVSEVIEVVIGNDGIAFANSKRGKQLDFTRNQIWKAMAAKGPRPTRWNEIDASLPNAKIEILAPPPTSGTRDAWNSLVMKGGCDPKVKETNKKDCELFREDGPVVIAGENDTLIVQKLNANPNAFGIFGFSYLEGNMDKVRAAKIDGVTISLASIQDYSYPVARPLFFYVKKAHVGVIPGLQEFMKEFTGMAAMGDDGYLADIGLVPLDKKKYEEVSRTANNMILMQRFS